MTDTNQLPQNLAEIATRQAVLLGEYSKSLTSDDDNLLEIIELGVQLDAALQARAQVQGGEVVPAAWMAMYVDKLGHANTYVTIHYDLAVENDMHGAPQPLYTTPQPAPVSQAEVTDEQIKMLIPCGDAWKYEVGFPEAIQFARSILALRPSTAPNLTCKSVQARLAAQWGYVRPERVPMAYEQIKAEFQRKQDELSEKGASANCPTDLIDFTVGIRFAEAHHGITAQAKKEGA